MTHTYIQIQYVIIYLQHSTGNGQADRFDMRFLSVEIYLIFYFFYLYELEMQRLN